MKYLLLACLFLAGCHSSYKAGDCIFLHDTLDHNGLYKIEKVGKHGYVLLREDGTCWRTNFFKEQSDDYFSPVDCFSTFDKVKVKCE